MTNERLVFNGINGTTGTYGLAPMSGQQLAAHIQGDTAGEEDEFKVIEERLSRGNRANEVAVLVRLLAESNQENIMRDEVWQRQWRKKLASALAEELLGETFATHPEKLRTLEKRLARDTTATIEQIVRLLVENKLQELANLLFVDADLAPTIKRELEVKLRRFAQDQMKAVADHSLGDHLAAKLMHNKAAQREWLQEFITGLQLVPITAINARRRRLIFVRPLQDKLDELARVYPTVGTWLGDLRQKLINQPNLSWHDFLICLQAGLSARLDATNDPVSWIDLLATLRNWLKDVWHPLSVRGVIEGVDPTDLAQAGWGIIFPVADQALPLTVAAIKEALKPLLDLRRSQAGQHFKEYYERGAGYRPNDTVRDFLRRQNARPEDPADPDKVPYYLLIVGSPEAIPFHFQYQLDVQYAVGRIDFGNNLDAYARYAQSVVACEKEVKLTPRAAFFGTTNPNDQMTALSAQHLVTPLYTRLQERYREKWQFDKIVGQEASRDRLLQLVGGDDAPALLFTACHGMEFPKDDDLGRQVGYQGALLCQDWAGPEADSANIPRSYFLAGEDLPEQANLQGMIAFFFACYSAGTPLYDEYTKQAFKERGETITDAPFIAALPKAMLSLQNGGALAVVGHVERAWGMSFLGQRQSQQIAVFESALEHILKGHPVGSAMEYFNGRYAALSTELTATLDEASFGRRPEDYELAELWTANNDARGYIIIGDPAVCLPIAKPEDVGTGGRSLAPDPGADE